jgi:hypothetical protein
MKIQCGGAFRVSGYIALALLALAAIEAAMVRHLYSHRNIEITMPTSYEYSAFPNGREVCDGFNTICWIRI